MQNLNVGDELFTIRAMTLADTSRAQLDAEAAAIYQVFAEREREFGFGPGVIVDYPPITDSQGDGFLADPTGYIDARVNSLERDTPISKVVVLTTFGQHLIEPLSASGYTPVRIDMPAGPDNTYAFTLNRGDRDGFLLYIEAVNEADEKIRPTFVLKLFDHNGRLRGGACGAVHARAGEQFAYLATLTLAPGAPPSTGSRFAGAMLDFLRSQGVATVHLGTQTAGRFYEKLGFRVNHRLVSKLRTRVSASGEQLSDDLVMLSMDL